MELALTFGAFGDLLALGTLIKSIIVSLDDCRGSSKEYQDLARSLVLLDSALQEVDQISRDPRRVGAASRLCDTAQKSVHHIQQALEGFNARLQKFSASLGPGGSGNRFKDAARKIQFKLDEKDVAAFRGEVTGYTVVLKMLMDAMTLHSIDKNHEEVKKALQSVTAETQQTRSRLETSSKTLFRYVTDMGRQVLDKLAFLTQATTTLQNTASQIASSVLSISLELSSFRILLMTLQQGPVDKYYFTLEDAIGRMFPIHLNTITSWDALAFVLSEKFEGSSGATRVRNRRYKLIEHATQREIDQTKCWERSFLPRQKIVMSLLCKEPSLAPESASQLATCPWCKTESASDTSTQVQCRSCNMFFTRVVELDDVVLPPQPFTTREAPQFGKPSFDVPLPPKRAKDGRKRRNKDTENQARHTKKVKYDGPRNSKRCHAGQDDDSESDDEDVGGLMRVTIISRRKRIKVFQVPTSSPGTTTSLIWAPAVSATKKGTVALLDPREKMQTDVDSGHLVAGEEKGAEQKTGMVGLAPQKHAPMPYEALMQAVLSVPTSKPPPEPPTPRKVDMKPERSPECESLVGDAADYQPESEHEYYDDDESPFDFEQDRFLYTTFASRYFVFKTVRWNAAEQVLEARDMVEERSVMIKIIHYYGYRRDTWYESSDDDVGTLLGCLRRPVVDSFIFQGYQCLVTTNTINHRGSLLRFIVERPSAPLALSQVGRIAKQLFEIAKEPRDRSMPPLTTENITLVDSRHTGLHPPGSWWAPSVSRLSGRIVRYDRVFLDERAVISIQSETKDGIGDSELPMLSSGTISNRSKAPEFLLGVSQDSRPGDVWTIGCAIIELLTNDVIFLASDIREHLAMMQRLCGCEIDESLVALATAERRQVEHDGPGMGDSAQPLFSDGKLIYPTSETQQERADWVNNLKGIDDITLWRVPVLSARQSLLDLLKKIFVFDPDKRITAEEALAHPAWSEWL